MAVRVSVAFLRGYLETMDGSSILPTDPDEVRDLLQVVLAEKTVAELADTLSARPERAAAPIRGLLQLSQA